MIWLILGFICLIAWIVFLKKDEEIGYIFTCIGFFVFTIVGICLFCNGISDYGKLKEDYTKVESYRNRLPDIKNAYYKVPFNKDVMINGNIENMKQSTALSEYIKELTVREANYFSYLQKCKVYKEIGIYY